MIMRRRLRLRALVKFCIWALVALKADLAGARRQETANEPTVGQSELSHIDASWYDVEKNALRPIALETEDEDVSYERDASSSSGSSVDFFQISRAVSVIAMALLAFALGLLVFWFWHNGFTLGDQESPQERKKVSVDPTEALAFLGDRKRGDLLELARQAYLRCDYNEAIVYLFSHQLVQLDAKALIRLDQGKTNWQYLREASSSPPLQSLLERTMTLFEEAFFGRRFVDKDRFEARWNDMAEFEKHLQAI